MAVERTFSIVKPDAVAKNAIGEILARFEAAGLKIIAARMMHLSRAQAEGFYAVHRERPFFKDLVDFMISGPVLVQVLQGDNAILKNRELMGATDPKKAAKGTIRADFAASIDANAVHGSDAPEPLHRIHDGRGEVGPDGVSTFFGSVAPLHSRSSRSRSRPATPAPGPENHYIHQVLEERPPAVHRVEALGLRARQVQ